MSVLEVENGKSSARSENGKEPVFYSSKTIIETSRPAATGKTHAAMAKVSTSSKAIQSDLA